MSSRQSRASRVLAILAAFSASTETANASSQSYTIAGVYETKSENARVRASKRIPCWLPLWAVTFILTICSFSFHIKIVSKIDLDQKEIEDLLRRSEDNDDSNWLQRAREVYENGMHSGPYAKLTLVTPLDHQVDLPEPEEVFYKNDISMDNKKQVVYKLNVVGGNADLKQALHGTIHTVDAERSFPVGKPTELYVQYPESSLCNVDGNVDDCFAGPSGGLVLQGYGAIDYTYDPHVDNKFMSSLKQFSEEEGMRMLYCENHGGCAFPEYQHFYNYYGILDYGHHWINAAFSQTSTEYSANAKLKHGNENFSLWTDASRNQAIRTATVAMNVFTSVNRLMVEQGIDACNKNTRDFSSYGEDSGMKSVIADWDAAVATYAGSALVKPLSETSPNDESGFLYYNMVEELAKEFGVLEISETASPRSILNRKIMQQFEAGRVGLQHGDCDGAAKVSYQNIVSMMRVPWIQGVLRSAFRQSVATIDDGGVSLEKERGRGAAYLAALLPDLYHCSKEAADVVYNELKITQSSDYLRLPEYETIRVALEEQYECLAVTCDDVGGYLNPKTGNYFKSTRPCGGYGASRTHRRDSVAYDSKIVGHNKARNSWSGSTIIPYGSVVAALVFCGSLAALFITMNEHSRTVGGQRMSPMGVTGRFFSAMTSQADYWMSRNSRSNSSYRNYDYENASTSEPSEFQLRSFHSPSHISSGDSLI